MLVLEKIISGGQTGVDRAALDAALDLGFPCGGWCPQGRLAEDGAIPDKYPLVETASPSYPVRTQRNVLESDGTLIITRGEPSGGTALTVEITRKLARPCLVLDLREQLGVKPVREWLREHRIHVLNVAGPRESQPPGIYQDARWLMELVLRVCSRIN